MMSETYLPSLLDKVQNMRESNSQIPASTTFSQVKSFNCNQIDLNRQLNCHINDIGKELETFNHIMNNKKGSENSQTLSRKLHALFDNNIDFNNENWNLLSTAYKNSLVHETECSKIVDAKNPHLVKDPIGKNFINKTRPTLPRLLKAGPNEKIQKTSKLGIVSLESKNHSVYSRRTTAKYETTGTGMIQEGKINSRILYTRKKIDPTKNLRNLTNFN